MYFMHLFLSQPICSEGLNVSIYLRPLFVLLIMLPKSINCLDWFRDPGPYRDLFGVLGPYWVSIYISGSLFSVFWLHSREECLIQSTCIQQHCVVLNHHLLMKIVSIFVGNGSGLRCWRILIFSHAYAINFINRCFGSLFWLLGVPISQKNGSLLGPYWVPISKLGGP